MYLEKLILVNFQSHKYTELNFEPGLNVIVGESDRGKTAILRALRWLFYNEPKGTEFIRVGEKEARVTAHFSNGLVLSRERSDRKNRYVLIKPGEEPVVFEKFGQELPPEIVEAIGIKKIRLDKDWEVALNFASQLEPPFLLFESATRKAKAIGQFQGVHLLDYAAKMVSRDIRGIDEQLRYQNNEITALQERLLEFADLPELAIKLNNLKTRRFIVKKAQERLNTLNLLHESLIETKQKITENRQILKILSQVSKVQYQEIESLYQRYQNLIKLKNTYDGLRAKKNEALEILSRTEMVAELKERQESARNNYFKLKTLQQLFEKKQKTLEQKRKLSYVVAELRPLEMVGQNYQELLPRYQKWLELKKKQLELQKLLKHKNYYAGIIYQYRKIPEGAQKVKEIAEKLKRHEELSRLLKNLQAIKQKKSEQEKEVAQMTKELLQLQNQYREELLNAGRCPTCHTPLDETTVQKIIFS